MKHFGKILTAVLPFGENLLESDQTITPQTPALNEQTSQVQSQSSTNDAKMTVTPNLNLNNLKNEPLGKPPRPKQRQIPQDILDSLAHEQLTSVKKASSKPSPRSSLKKPSPRSKTPTNTKTTDDKPLQTAAALGLAILQKTRSTGSLKISKLSAETIKTLVHEHVEVEEDDFSKNLSFNDEYDADASTVPSIVQYSGDVSDKEFLDAIIKNASAGEVTEMITLHNANVDACDRHGQSALHYAAQNGNTEVVKVLLEFGADCDVVASNNSWTALHWAAQGGHVTIVKMLASFVKNIDAVEKFGWTALLLATNNGFAEIVDILGSKGASLEVRTEAGLTPLLLATRSFFSNVVSVLCRLGADLEVVATDDETGYRPIHWATENESIDIVTILCEHGADTNATTKKEGWTPLMIACMHGNAKLVEILMRYGASKHKRDKQGLTAIQMALERGYVELPTLIKDIGKQVKENLNDTLDQQKKKLRTMEVELRLALERVKTLETLEQQHVQKIAELEEALRAFKDTLDHHILRHSH